MTIQYVYRPVLRMIYAAIRWEGIPGTLFVIRKEDWFISVIRK